MYVMILEKRSSLHTGDIGERSNEALSRVTRNQPAHSAYAGLINGRFIRGARDNFGYIIFVKLRVAVFEGL